MIEEWRDVVGYEGLYQVSNAGRVKRIEGKRVFSDGRVRHYSEAIVSPTKPDPYPRIMLHAGTRKRTTRVHQLVMEAFVGSPPSGMEVNHKNGDKADNRLDNLEYITHPDNVKHYNEVLGRGNQGSRHGMSKTNEDTVRKIRQLHKDGVSRHEIARLLGMGVSWVWKIASGKSWKHVE